MTMTKLAAHEDEPRDIELLAMLDEPDDAIRLESRSSRESKHKGKLHKKTLALATQ